MTDKIKGIHEKLDDIKINILNLTKQVKITNGRVYKNEMDIALIKQARTIEHAHNEDEQSWTRKRLLIWFSAITTVLVTGGCAVLIFIIKTMFNAQ